MMGQFKKEIQNYFKAEKYDQRKNDGRCNFPEKFTKNDQYKEMMQNKKKTESDDKSQKFTPI